MVLWEGGFGYDDGGPGLSAVDACKQNAPRRDTYRSPGLLGALVVPSRLARAENENEAG